MIIPVRCFTCGHVLADKWVYWQKELRRIEENAATASDKEQAAPFDDVRAGALLDALGLRRMCCRRHLLTHVDIIDVT
jgi:DNA-directed RNA polymerase subunit N (RpoN/RPB10)